MENNLYIMIACVTLCVIFTTLFIVTRAIKGACKEGILTKALASFAFVLTGAYGLLGVKENLISYVLILLGLVCGLIGDIILELKMVYKKDGNAYLPYGMLAFGFGHVLYFTAINLILKEANIDSDVQFMVSVGVGCLLTIVIMAICKLMLKFKFGDFLPHAAIYTFILTFVTLFTAVMAFAMPKLFIMAGGLFAILISDMILSVQYFGGQANSRILHILNHSIYYLGQIMIAMFIFLSVM